MILITIGSINFLKSKNIRQKSFGDIKHLELAFPSIAKIQLVKKHALASMRLINPGYLEIPAVVPEELEATFLQRFDSECAASCLYVDVGTNKGQALFPLLHRTKNILAIAFEPDQSNCEFVRGKASDEYPGRLTIYCNGVGAYESKQQFSIDAAATSSFHIVENPRQIENTTTVRIRSIDETLDESEILLLKSDTQGFEKEVLVGSTSLFSESKIRFLVMEISYSLLRLHGTSEIEIFNLLYGWGYVCTYLAWHGVIRELENGELKYGLMSSPRFPENFISFAEFSHYLSPQGNPSKKGTWTDILCF